MRSSIKKRNIFNLLTVAVLAVGVSGCASIFTGTKQNLKVSSTPAGARCDLTQGDKRVGSVAQTPGTVRVGKSYKDVEVDCNLAGYQPGAAAARASFQPWAIGNLFLGGIIGFAIDMSTGATSRYPENVFVTLQPSRGPAAPTAYQQQAPVYGYGNQPSPYNNNQPTYGGYGYQPAPSTDQDVLIIDAGN